MMFVTYILSSCVGGRHRCMSRRGSKRPQVHLARPCRTPGSSPRWTWAWTDAPQTSRPTCLCPFQMLLLHIPPEVIIKNKIYDNMCMNLHTFLHLSVLTVLVQNDIAIKISSWISTDILLVFMIPASPTVDPALRCGPVQFNILIHSAEQSADKYIFGVCQTQNMEHPYLGLSTIFCHLCQILLMKNQ